MTETLIVPEKETGRETLRIHPRAKTMVALEIPTDVLASLERVAARRDMSVPALLRFYIGQSLREDTSGSESDK